MIKLILYTVLLLEVFTIDGINTSLKSGAIDVVAIEGKDGVIRSSPFFVQFGITRVLFPKGKKVTILLK